MTKYFYDDRSACVYKHITEHDKHAFHPVAGIQQRYGDDWRIRVVSSNHVWIVLRGGPSYSTSEEAIAALREAYDV